ncbi:MAG: hypothetical protein HZC54_18435 [Verrucomicrobia bacterium]|nr:hypothetical protein [Verrucomicrobiota bacterium]
MNRVSVILGLLLLVICGARHSRAAGGAMQEVIAALSNDASVRIIYTDVLGDKKSVRNDLQVSPERTFHLILRETRLVPAAKGKPSQDRWQLLIHAREWNGQELLESGSLAEKKLIWLLHRRAAVTTDAAEKLNASTLVGVLMNRSQSFPAPNSGKWALRSAALTKKP